MKLTEGTVPIPRRESGEVQEKIKVGDLVVDRGPARSGLGLVVWSGLGSCISVRWMGERTRTVSHYTSDSDLIAIGKIKVGNHVVWRNYNGGMRIFHVTHPVDGVRSLTVEGVQGKWNIDIDRIAMVGTLNECERTLDSMRDPRSTGCGLRSREDLEASMVTQPAPAPLKLAPPIIVPAGSRDHVSNDGRCWIRWYHNRGVLEGRIQGLMHDMDASEIAAAKRYDSMLWDEERSIAGPRKTEPKLTILVDQDIED